MDDLVEQIEELYYKFAENRINNYLTDKIVGDKFNLRMALELTIEYFNNLEE